MEDRRSAQQRRLQERRMASCPLTPRQLEVVGWLSRGYNTRRIAQRLVLSPKTVDNHVEGAMARLGVSTRAHAVALAHHEGWIAPDVSVRYARRTGAVLLSPRPPPRIDRRIKPLSAFQRSYLAAFDAHLRARTPEDVAITRRLMGIGLMGIREQAQVAHRPRKEAADPLLRIALAIQGVRPPKSRAPPTGPGALRDGDAHLGLERRRDP